MGAFFALCACGGPAAQPPEAGMGRSPALPPPARALIPTVHIAPALGWPVGKQPTALPGLQVTALATGLDHPRWLLVLPNGDLLVAESNAPPKPDDAPGIKGWVMKWVMKRAGAGVPSADRITLLRDADGDGVAEIRTTFLANLHSPFGMALVGNTLYVANTDAVLRFDYTPGQTSLVGSGTRLVELPAGPINHHWTRNLIASPDGRRLYVTVGSNSNVAENGMAAEAGRAAIWEVDRLTGAHRVFASGLRNPNGLGWQPDSGVLWTVVNERDELGNDLVPDYLTAVREGAFYGWPYSYFGPNVDPRVQPARPDLVAQAVVPDYALGSHVAPLGLAFTAGLALLPELASGAFVGEHGSWNRTPRSGYKVVFVPFANGQPVGLPLEVLTGFVSPEGKAWGRPVGVVVDARGALLVADDVGNTVWRVSSVARP
ncbi:MAG: sorbosone dehydrogenase family protein [Acidovorax sp.]|nr:sorbosone dehydrogenase family protein [Acidovorax sp.]